MPAEELPPRSSDPQSPAPADDFRVHVRTPARVPGKPEATSGAAPLAGAARTEAPGPMTTPNDSGPRSSDGAAPGGGGETPRAPAATFAIGELVALRSDPDTVLPIVGVMEGAAETRYRVFRDGRRELLTAGGGKSGGTKVGGKTRGSKPASPASRRRVGRAPRGSVPRLVERELVAHPGSTAREIAGHATTRTERSIPLDSIRVELRKGRASGRYALEGKRWSLAVGAASGAVQESSPPDPAAAANSAGDGDAAEPGSREQQQTLGLRL